MSLLEIWILAITLAMDCFTVSMASGTAQKKIDLRATMLMALSFGLFQAAMPVIGWSGSVAFASLIESVDHWIAFGLLSLIGAKMIKESYETEEEKSLNVSSLRTILLLSVATSIDALAVGVTFTCVGMHTLTSILLPIGIIGLASFVLSIAGTWIGAYMRGRAEWPMERLGGIVLILLGVKILIQDTTDLL